MTDPKRLYGEDFVLWSRRQAEALRAAAQGASNLPLDWENLAGEIESLGLPQRRAAQSNPAHHPAPGETRIFAGNHPRRG